MSLRRFTEQALRGVTIRRRLPPEFSRAPIWVSPGAGLRYLFRGMNAVDPGLLDLAGEHVKPGDVVWDVGANVGLFSFAAAQRAGKGGRVVAFEPDIWLVGLLRKSAIIQPQSASPVNVLAVAVAQSVGVREFQIAMRSRATNFLTGHGSSQTGGSRETQLVMTVNLDWLASRFPEPDVIKIDVEGAEKEALEGGREIISRRRPKIICEVVEQHSEWIAHFLRGFGYQLYDADLPATQRRPLDRAPWNTLAIAK